MGIYTAVGTGSDLTSVGSSFSTSKKIEVKLNAPHPTRVVGQPFVGHLGALYVDITSLASSATKLSIRVSTDGTAGDIPIVIPDTEATLALGITTTTEGSAAYSIDVPYADLGKTDSVYVYFKTDTGTVSIAAADVRISWTD